VPSRRQFLASASTALGVGSLAGCLTELGLAKTGHVEEKAIILDWSHDGQSYRDDVLSIWSDSEAGTITGRYDPNFVGNAVRAPDDVVVNERVHERLSRRFDVQYLLGICGPAFGRDGEQGCRNTWTSRADFNRVQLTDRAEVRLSDHRFDVLDVYEDAFEVESADVRTHDFAAVHADDGIRADEW